MMFFRGRGIGASRRARATGTASRPAFTHFLASRARGRSWSVGTLGSRRRRASARRFPTAFPATMPTCGSPRTWYVQKRIDWPPRRMRRVRQGGVLRSPNATLRHTPPGGTAMPRVSVLAGPTDGLFVLESDGKRSRWRTRGPYLAGISVNHTAWSPTHKTLYATTSTEGVLRSTNSGRTWTPINDGLPIRKVWTLSVNPKHPNELWAGTHFSYLFRSPDRGRSWQLAGGDPHAPGKEPRRGGWGGG